MALFGYLFDSDFKKKTEEDKRRDKPHQDVASDPFEEAKTVRRLRADMSRLMVLNRSLITLLIQNEVITLEELTRLTKSISQEDDSSTPDQMEVCKECGRHSFRAKANCVYCDSLQL